MTTNDYKPTVEDAIKWEAWPKMRYDFCLVRLDIDPETTDEDPLSLVAKLEACYARKLKSYRTQMAALATRCAIACQILGDRDGSLWALTFTDEGQRIFEIMKRARSLAKDAQRAALEASGTE